MVQFQTKGVNFKIKNDPISMKLWVNERENYTKIQKEKKSVSSKEYILVLEVNTLHVNVQNNISLNVLVRYF